MQFDVRPYDEADEAAVVALWSEVFAYNAPHNSPLDLVRQKRAYEQALFFVALVHGRLVGTVMGGYDGHRGWIYSLAVSDTERAGDWFPAHAPRRVAACRKRLPQNQPATAGHQRRDGRFLSKTGLCG